MATKVREFRSLIYKHYDTETQFAEKLNWPRQKLNKLTNGKKMPDIQELDELSKGLNVSVSLLADIFLNQSSPNEQQKND